MRAKLCVTVTGRTMAELRQRRDTVSDADLVELRVDGVADPSAAAALAGRQRPVIFTCRPTWEGGGFAGTEEERRRLLREAQQLGAEYVDLEWRAGFDDVLAARHGRGIVLSQHDYAGVPADLSAQVDTMRRTGAEVVKVAVMAHRLADCLPLLAIANGSTTPSVLIAMGDAGLTSRVCAARFNSCWTYAGDSVAPGQIPASRLLDDFAFRRLTADTRIYGVVGQPIMHSLSPAMHNAAFAAAGMDAVYLPLAAASFIDFLTFAEALGLQGASVTAPFKRDAFDSAATRDAMAERVGAANTLRRTVDGWEAINTDVAGFLDPLHAHGIDARGKRVTILGAGGAARAVAHALQTMGAAISIAARHTARATEMAQRLHGTVVEWPPAAHSWDILVNTTPVGTAPANDETPLPGGPFTGELVLDVIYNPPDTRLLRDARQAGCRTIGGLDMLVAQAERQFEWWTGLAPAAGVMRRAAERVLDTSLSIGTLR